jgi:hypothetical protein
MSGGWCRLSARASLGLILGAIAGCAASEAEQPISTGLSRLVDQNAAPAGGPTPLSDPPPAAGSLAEAAARDSALGLLAMQGRAVTPSGPPPAEPMAIPAKSVVAEPPTGDPPTTRFVGPPTPPEVELAARIVHAAGDLESLLRDRAAADPSFSAATPLAALEPVHPGITEGWLSENADTLSPPEEATLRTFADLTAAMAGTGGDPVKAADALESAAEGLAGSLPIRIGAAELCTRVDGFGQYQPVDGNVFQAMRPQRLIVYTEVERFAHRPIAGSQLRGHHSGPGDLWAVHLTQELQLYNESGAMSAWSRPALPIVETSRNKRRDFHIVDQIELPPNLSIGVYHLKVTVTDKATGAQDTRSIRVRIVADPALARKDE